LADVLADTKTGIFPLQFLLLLPPSIMTYAGFDQVE
jgi:hypothetical protein